MLRDHGQAKKYHHDIEGYNGRLDAIQAGILQVKLRHLSDWNDKRRAHADVYKRMLSSADGLVLPFEPEWARAIYHLFVIRTRDRQQLRDHLVAANIGTGIHYPVPLHLQPIFAGLKLHEGGFPRSERAGKRVLSLPMHPYLETDQIVHIASAVRQAVANCPI